MTKIHITYSYFTIRYYFILLCTCNDLDPFFFFFFFFFLVSDCKSFLEVDGHNGQILTAKFC